MANDVGNGVRLARTGWTLYHDAIVHLEQLDDLHLLVVWHFLQHVSQPVILQFAGDLDAALDVHLMQGIGEVGGLHLIVRSNIGAGCLRFMQGRVDDRIPGHQQAFPAGPAQAQQPAGGFAAAHVVIGDDPVPVAFLAQPDVLHRRIAGAVGKDHAAVKKLGGDQDLGATLDEAAHVHQAGADDLARFHGGDAGHRDKHAAFAGDLDDHADALGGFGERAGNHHDVTQPAQAVAQRVEHVKAQQACDEDLRRIAAHAL